MSRRMTCAGHVALIVEKGSAWRILVGKPERKTAPEIPRCRWEDNIKMDLKEIGWGGID
jgi:hypothetical protein